MKKPNKSQAPSELDVIVTQLRILLNRDTISVIEKGRLLLRSRELLADEHGQWMPWLAENFDMNYRTAVRYMAAAEYADRLGKSDSVSHLANIAPIVLYRLAAGEYTAEQEAEILATAKVERVDIARADGICEELCEELEPEEDDLDEETRTLDATREIIEAAKAAEAEDAEIEVILDGPSPLPPPEPSSSPDMMVCAFDQAISALMQLMTKPAARFAGTAHNSSDLEHVEDFVRAVADRTRSPASAEASSGPIYSTTAASDVNQGEEATQ